MFFPVCVREEQPWVRMHNDRLIPQVGLGTYKIAPEEVDRAIKSAFDLGVRHIDTAQMYHNEAAVGAAWKSSGLERERFFLTSKLNNNNHLPADARRSFEQSLRDLQTDYVDLFLIHWPLPMHYDGNFEQTWEVLLEFAAQGKAKTVGVSNFEPEHIDRLIAATGVTPLVNQVEAHPFFANPQVVAYNEAHNIVTEAWSPLARGRVTTDPTIQEIAADLGRTPSQVALRWALQKGWVVFPKSVHPERIAENFDVFDFLLDDTAMQRLDSLHEGEAGRTGRHPNLMDVL